MAGVDRAAQVDGDRRVGVVEQIAAERRPLEVRAHQDRRVFEAVGGEHVAIGPDQDVLAGGIDRLDPLDATAAGVGAEAGRDGLGPEVEAAVVEHGREPVEG